MTSQCAVLSRVAADHFHDLENAVLRQKLHKHFLVPIDVTSQKDRENLLPFDLLLAEQDWRCDNINELLNAEKVNIGLNSFHGYVE